MTPNQKAFLDMVAFSEIGQELLLRSDNGYDVLVGSTPAHPMLFSSYAKHPNILNAACNSTAAGRYQTLHRFAVAYMASLKLPDFGPDSQDKIALQQIRERRALPMIESGKFDDAVAACSNLWASLPGAGYAQHENRLADLRAAYVAAGGALA